jgi:hypothetical protein
MMRHGSGNGYSLPFPNRQLAGKFVYMALDMETFGDPFNSASSRQSQPPPANADILTNGKKWKQATGLQHVADVPHARMGQAVQGPALPGFHNVQPLSLGGKKREFPGLIRPQHHGQQVQQGTLAASAKPHQGNLFSLMDNKLRHRQGKAVYSEPAFSYLLKAKDLIHRSGNRGYMNSGLVPKWSSQSVLRQRVSGSVQQRSHLLHIQKSSPSTVVDCLFIDRLILPGTVTALATA